MKNLHGKWISLAAILLVLLVIWLPWYLKNQPKRVASSSIVYAIRDAEHGYGSILLAKLVPNGAGFTLAREITSLTADQAAADQASGPRDQGTDFYEYNNKYQCPRFSPDGKHIVYVYDAKNNYEFHIYIMDSDGRHKRRLTSGPWSDTEASFSPDGNNIVFVSNRDYHKPAVEIKRTTAKRDLHQSDSTIKPPSPQALLSEQHENALTGNCLYTMSVFGRGVKRLTMEQASVPSYSPDGKSIVYSATGTTLVVMRADGSNPQRLAIESGGMGLFSPDGTKIYYTANNHIFVMNTDGSAHQQLPVDTSGIDIAFGPYSNRLLYYRSDGGIHSAALDGSEQSAQPVLPKMYPSNVSCFPLQ